MNGTIASADLILCYSDGNKSTINLEPELSEALLRFIHYAEPRRLPRPVTDDPLFDAELYREDPYYTPEEQADIRRLKADADAGINMASYDPRKRREARLGSV